MSKNKAPIRACQTFLQEKVKQDGPKMLLWDRTSPCCNGVSVLKALRRGILPSGRSCTLFGPTP